MERCEHILETLADCEERNRLTSGQAKDSNHVTPHIPISYLFDHVCHECIETIVVCGCDYSPLPPAPSTCDVSDGLIWHNFLADGMCQR